MKHFRVHFGEETNLHKLWKLDSTNQKIGTFSHNLLFWSVENNDNSNQW